MVGCPGKRAMCQCFCEYDGRSRFCRYLLYYTQVPIYTCDIAGCFVVGFVAAWNAGKSALAGVAIGEYPRDYGEATAHAPIVKLIEVREVVGRAPAVYDMAFGSFFHDDAIEVVETAVFAQQFREVGYDVWMGEQIAKGLTPGFGPGEHAAQIGAPVFALECSGFAGERLLWRANAHPVGVVVNGFVAGGNFVGC